MDKSCPDISSERIIKLGEDFPDLCRDYHLALFDGFPAMIWRSNAAQKNDYFNKQWLAFTGRTLREEIETTWPQRLHPDDLPNCRQIWFESSQKRQPVEMQYRIRRFDGEYRWIEDERGPMYDLKGNFSGYVGICKDITDRKIAEEGLRRYQILSQEILDIILFIELGGKIIDANDAAIKAYGYTREELLSLTIFSLLKTNRISSEQLKRVQESGLIFEDIHYRKDGSSFPVEVNMRGTDIGDKKVLLSITRDISERKKAEMALRDSEQRYRRLFEVATDGIILFELADEKDSLPKIVEVNEVTCQRLGYSKEEMLKLGLPDFNKPKNQSFYLNILNQIITRQNYTFENIRITKTGQEIPVEVNAHFFEMNGKKYILQLARDITERKRAEEKLQQSMVQLHNTLKSAINSLSSAIEMRDPYTAGHQERVTRFAVAIAKEMGLSAEQREGIQIAGAVHDIGKLAIPAEILSKPTKLSATEYSLIKTHSQVGATILSKIEFPWPIAEIVHQHHEKINGSGYPRGLSGKEILLEARILCVADVIEAISSHRPYRPSLGMDKALEEITLNRGILYDPDVVEVCRRLIGDKKFD